MSNTPDDKKACTTCGHQIPTEAAYCISCGQGQPARPLAADHPAGPHQPGGAPVRAASAASSPRLISRGAVGVSITVVILLVLTAAGLFVQHRDTKADLRAERTAHTRTRAQLSRARSSLASVQADLARTKDTLASTQDDLADVTKERDTAKDELLWVSTQLEGVRNTLGNANDQIGDQAALIEDLKTCLGGVAAALSSAASYDYDTALAELDAVETDCKAAADAI